MLLTWGQFQLNIVAQLFSAGEPGVHFETYNPDALCPRRNVLQRSEDFTNAVWAPSNITVTGDVTVAPDGNTTADKLVPNTTNAAHAVTFNITANGSVPLHDNGTFSFYAKAAGYTGIAAASGPGTYTWFDLTGTGNTFLGALWSSASVVSVGNGWFLCTMTGGTSLGAWGSISIYPVAAFNPAGGSPAFAGDGASGVYVWGAQGEQSPTRSPYQKVTDWNTEYLAAVGAANVGMWQDSAAATAVTGIEQPVGKWIDKSGRGNHASQATASARPVLSARYNLLTKTEQLTDSAWTKTNATVAQTTGVTAPDGTQNGVFTLTEAASATLHWIGQVPTVVANVAYTLTVIAKKKERSWIALDPSDSADNFTYFDLVNGVVGTNAAGNTASIQALGNGWFRCSVTRTINTTATNFVVTTATADATNTYAGDGASGVYLWHPDVRTANDAALNIPAYQRVNTSTDYDTTGFIHYLKFDGVNDGFQTAAINFSTGDKMTVWAGVTKLSDAAAGIAAELTATASATNGGFYVAGPSSAAANFGTANRGTTTTTAGSVAGFTSPVSAVLTAQFDNAAATSALQNILRENGTQQTLTFATGPTSGGNFANDILNIGGRNNSISAPYNGRMTSLTVRGSTTPSSTAFIQKMEQYAAKLAGLSFVSS